MIMKGRHSRGLDPVVPPTEKGIVVRPLSGLTSVEAGPSF